MKNLVFDIGNTLAKYAVFQDGIILDEKVLEQLTEKECQDIIDRNSGIDAVLFSAVGELSDDVVAKMKELVDYVIVANHETALPCKNSYKTKETLGFDRIAACIGATCIEPNKNILVIDAGTAITYDLITAEGEYLGGLISPGISMRYRALSEFTVKLPLCEITNETPLVGTTTRESIVGGVQNGVINELSAYISSINDIYADINVFLTGGDAFFFDKKLKNSIFVNQKLLFYGLNRILEYNAEK